MIDFGIWMSITPVSTIAMYDPGVIGAAPCARLAEMTASHPASS
jgi:hypothetical protein